MEPDAFVAWPDYNGTLTCKVEDFNYNKGRVYLSGSSNYFDNVPENLWLMYIGGYQPLQKWLKDRKGQTLTEKEVTHYGRIIMALKSSQNLMDEIDSIINL